jgi:predicted aspartyl protease
MNILGIFKKADGEYEVNRTVGAIGGLVYIFAGPALVLANIIKNVSFTEFCIAYPGGLGVVVSSIAGAVAVKDRNVATAKVIADTGNAPGLASPGPAAGPMPVVVQQPPGQPVPVEETK